MTPVPEVGTDGDTGASTSVPTSSGRAGDESDVAWYAAPTGMTRLPDLPQIEGLPDDVDGIRRVVQGLVVHRSLLAAYGMDAGQARIDEANLRSTAEVLDRAVALDGRPLVESRAPAERVQGICRHLALLHTAFLRAAGAPARVRCGFSCYSEPDRWIDHWITERWDRGRWARDDPQADDVQIALFGLDFDPHDQPPGRFLDGCEAWIATRAGDLDAQRFGIFDMWGPAFIAGNVMSDVACLNKVELLPWDDWGLRLEWGPHDPVPEAAAEVLDELARLVVSGDDAAVRARYESDDRVRVPSQISTFVDGAGRTVTIDL